MAERERLFGYAPPGADRNHLQLIVLAAGVALLLGFAGIVYAERPAGSRTYKVSPVIYGVAGPQGICTEETIGADGAWSCLAWQSNETGARIVAPAAYGGPCGHVIADQARGAWSCLDS